MALPRRRVGPRWQPVPLFLLAALLPAQTLLPVPSHARTAFAQSEGRRPLDPLTNDERAQAVSIVEGDERASRLTLLKTPRGRMRRISVELADVKPPAAPAGAAGPDRSARAGRYAEVLYFRYDTNDGVRALVDLNSRRVADVAVVDARAVPISPEEVEEAAALALRNPQLRALLGASADRYRAAQSPAEGREGGEYRVDALRILATTPNDPCYRRRCLALLFRQGRTYLTYTEVTADLTSQTVRVVRRRP